MLIRDAKQCCGYARALSWRPCAHTLEQISSARAVRAGQTTMNAAY